MKRKYLALLLALVLAVGLLPGTAFAADASGTCGDNVTWSLNNGVLTIEGTGPMDDYGIFVGETRAPWYASYRDQIRTIVIGDGVTSIGKYAFLNCNNLTSLVIGNGITSIGKNEFSNCKNLTSVVIGDGVTSIGQMAFQSCDNLTSVVIGDGVTEIGYSAFGYCRKLSSLTMGSNVTSIGERAFDSCTSLTSVTIPCSVTPSDGDASIGLGAFVSCTGLTSVVIGDGITSIKDSAFQECTNLTSVVIGNGVTEIKYNAFGNCANLTSLIIGSGVTKIGTYAFRGCGLTSVTIPGSVTDMSWLAFYNCPNLTSVVICDGVTNIGLGAFNDCSNLTSVTIPESVTEIGLGAFGGCYNLAHVYYGGSESQFGNISVSFGTATYYDVYIDSNVPLLAAEFHYNGTDPDTTKPTTPTEPELPTKFTDVPVGAYYADAVNWAVENNVTSGKTSTTFEPSTPCSRAEIVTFLWRAYGSQEPTSTTNPFTDVSESAFYYKAVLWAVENGITSGTTSTTFSPSGTCTRDQAVTFQWRAAGRPAVSGGSSFTDVDSNAYYADAVAWAVANNITQGTSTTTFNPSGICDRGQIVTFLYREMGK